MATNINITIARVMKERNNINQNTSEFLIQDTICVLQNTRYRYVLLDNDVHNIYPILQDEKFLFSEDLIFCTYPPKKKTAIDCPFMIFILRLRVLLKFRRNFVARISD